MDTVGNEAAEEESEEIFLNEDPEIREGIAPEVLEEIKQDSEGTAGDESLAEEIAEESEEI